jgi:hypothetical protein
VQVRYTHASEPGGDGFVWGQNPTSGVHDLLAGSSFITPDFGINYGNFTNGVTRFDDQYVAAGRGPLIDAEAWWGNPLGNGAAVPNAGPEIELGFYNLESGGAAQVSFDFAWARSGSSVSTTLLVHAYDYDAGPEGEDYHAPLEFSLEQVFDTGPAWGGGSGAAGSVAIDFANLVDRLTQRPFTSIDDLWLDLSPIASPVATSEFALDHLDITPIRTNSPLAADFDRDGDVDIDDLARWESGWGVDALSDADGDCLSDGGDWLIWQQQTGSAFQNSDAAVSVPENTAWPLLIVLELLTHARRRISDESRATACAAGSCLSQAVETPRDGRC